MVIGPHQIDGHRGQLLGGNKPMMMMMMMMMMMAMMMMMTTTENTLGRFDFLRKTGAVTLR